MAFDVVHRAWIKHQAADFLSRMETYSYETVELEYDLPTYVVETIEGSIKEGEMY